MVDISDDAKKELNAYFEGKDKSPIRIYMAPGGCSGPRLILALDEPTDQDKVEEVEGFKFVINSELADQVKNVKIELSPIGFEVIPEVPLPQAAGGGCGGCCGGCGSH